MPAFITMGRRWNIATDDFVIIGILDSIFYFFWWYWSIAVYSSFRHDQDCSCQADHWFKLLQLFYICTCFSHFISFTIAATCFFISRRGTISDTKPREAISILFPIKYCFAVVDVPLAILGSILLTQSCTCEDFHVMFTLKVLTWAFWILTLVRLGFLWITYDPAGKIEKTPGKFIYNEYLKQTIPEDSIKKWKYRLKPICFWSGVSAEAKEHCSNVFSKTLAFLFKDYDIVFSDFVAALIIYKRECDETRKILEDLSASSTSLGSEDGSVPKDFSTSDTPPWMNLKQAFYYFPMSFAVCGWYWALHRNFFNGIFSIWRHMRYGFAPGRNMTNVVGGDFCNFKLCALLTLTKHRYEDFVYISFTNQVHEIPFFVVIDEKTSSVVISLRSSASLKDFLTCVTWDISPIDDEFLPEGAMCHTGVLLTSRKIMAKFEQLGILQKAFAGRVEYTLVITGISLGAAVASLLTLLLRKSYPNIRCFAFSPPAIFNEVAVKETKDCVFSIFTEKDIIPSLTLGSLQKLIARCFEIVNECKFPKYKVLLGWFDLENSSEQSSVALRSNLRDSDKSEEKQSNTGPIGGENELQQLSTCTDSLRIETKFVPGTIHKCEKSACGYRLRRVDTHELDTLIASSGMIRDHMPDVLESHLRELVGEEATKPKAS